MRLILQILQLLPPYGQDVLSRFPLATDALIGALR